MAYFVVDLSWVTIIPHCVKSPRTIVQVGCIQEAPFSPIYSNWPHTVSTLNRIGCQHHLVVICYMFAPIFWPEYRWFMGALLSVEINTWFLILRRVVYKRKIAMLSDAVAFSFYLSWIVIRCYIYPAILVHFLYLATITIRATGQFWHWPMIFIPVHFVLVVLNLKWSYDLFYPIVKAWIVSDADKPTVANGL